jgi:2',3'-cyclic-nucleotide 2'-phosphodiesterase (5'-nucleotidase family)
MSKLFFYFIPAILFFGCNPVYKASTVNYIDYSVQQKHPDSSIISFLKPYTDSVNNSMNVVIATLAHDIDKKQPEGTLGNLMADGMKIMAEKNYKMPVDAAFINFGGVRLTFLKAGTITRGKVFELMPFDNIIILQKLKGDVLQQFLDHVADRGGWPSAGITMQIKEKKAVNVMINHQPIDLNKTYTIANSDYIANGGDNCEMLMKIPQINKGFLLRDALIDYFSSFTKEGKVISVQLQNRVTNAQ